VILSSAFFIIWYFILYPIKLRQAILLEAKAERKTLHA